MRFTDALDTNVEEIERPPLLPVGTYTWVVSKPPEQDSIGDGKWDVVDYSLKCIAPAEDVDMEALQEFGGLDNVYRRLRFMFNTEDDAAFKKTEFYHKQFLTEHLGLGDSGTIKELMASAVGARCLAVIAWRPDKNNPEIMYDEIRRTAQAS